MLTIILETENDEDRLARVLAPLVPAAMEGFLRDVVIVDRQSTDGTRVVADVAGCTIVDVVPGRDDHLRRAVDEARGDWLLFLSVTSKPMSEGWQSAAFAAMTASRESGGRPAYLRRGRYAAGVVGRFFRLFGGCEGTLVSKAYWLSRAEQLSASPAASSVSGARRGAA